MPIKSDIDIAIEVILDKAAADARTATRDRILKQLATAEATPVVSLTGIKLTHAPYLLLAAAAGLMGGLVL